MVYFVKIYGTRYFSRWQRKEKLLDARLREAIEELMAGLHDGNLGAHVYKKRIAQSGRGKRGSYRTIIACKLFDQAFFMYGYPKNERDNISPKELEAYRDTAKLFLDMKIEQIESLLRSGDLTEVNYD